MIFCFIFESQRRVFCFLCWCVFFRAQMHAWNTGHRPSFLITDHAMYQWEVLRKFRHHTNNHPALLLQVEGREGDGN
ncbi:hypothetical protein BC939DRAFT_442438 [Gamsiella multidivaricata]|uniref:uncharacterized protein n=1 Tax=Gamsiella multidivaricata TaxID=101098 RepID=UPI00221FD534|nr:uncharacterized protein BC939DRAFT_442438 [Gamsiella multidivaricata]KAI7828985.1 hypothetical protein BC939DRAFT_442438 [Gamsiella multidivaricata]